MGEIGHSYILLVNWDVHILNVLSILAFAGLGTSQKYSSWLCLDPLLM